MNELNEIQKERLAIYKRLLDYQEHKKERNRYNLLTSSHFKYFYRVGEKRFTGEPLNESDRKAKSDAKLTMQIAFADISEIITFTSVPQSKPSDETSLFSDKDWKEIIPLANIAPIVKGLVQRFGEEYALQIAKGMSSGMKEYESRQGRSTDIDIPIIKRSESEGWESIDYGKIKKEKRVGRPKNTPKK